MHVLIGNLAVSDLMVGTVLLPSDMIADIFEWKRTNKYVCLSIFAVYVLSLGSSCCNLLLISIERFIAIAYPVRVKALFTKRKMIFIIAIAWILPFLNSTIPLYGVNSYTNTSVECKIEYVWTKDYRILTDWQILVALFVNFTLYAIVVWIAVRKSRREINVIGNSLNIHSRSRKDFHQLITMVIVLGTFMLCWLPYACLAFAVTFSDTPYHQLIKRYTLIPGMINSSINWMIYGYRKREFRRAFGEIIRCKSSKPERNNFVALLPMDSYSVTAWHVLLFIVYVHLFLWPVQCIPRTIMCVCRYVDVNIFISQMVAFLTQH